MKTFHRLDVLDDHRAMQQTLLLVPLFLLVGSESWHSDLFRKKVNFAGPMHNPSQAGLMNRLLLNFNLLGINKHLQSLIPALTCEERVDRSGGVRLITTGGLGC